MKRIKWLNLKLDRGIELGKLANSLRENAFSPTESHGFIIDELRPKHICGRYVRKRVVERAIISPFGEELREDYTTYESTDFVISGRRPGLEIVNSPRSLSEFLNQLGVATGYSLSVSDITVDLNAWIDKLRLAAMDVVITSMEYADVLIAPSIHGRITLFGKGDIRQEMEKLTEGKKRVLRRVKISLDGFPLTLWNTASIQIGKNVPDQVVDALRESLSEFF